MLTHKQCASMALAIAWGWFPALCLAAEIVAPDSPITAATKYYSNEVIVAASVITSLLGSALVALVWQPPQDLSIPINLTGKWARFIAGLAGGIAAFFYLLHTSNKLILLQPVWVLGVSFVTPIALQVAYPSLVDILSKIPEFFTGRNKE